MSGLGATEFVLIVGAVVFVFGWGRLSQVGNNFRQAIQNLKQMAQGDGEIDVTPSPSDGTAQKESHHVR